MTSDRRHRLAVVSLLAASGVLCASVIGLIRAQETSAPTIEIFQGELLELGVDTQLINPEYNWILTKDHEFLAAQRERFFQIRQSAPGAYKLDVSIQDETKSRTEHVSFLLNVREGRAPDMPSPPLGATGIIPAVSLFPPASPDGSVSLDPAGGVLTINPSGSAGEISSYAIDVDSIVDKNGDGNPENDADNAGTLSETNGTALRYFLRPFSTPRVVTVTLSSAANDAARVQFPVVFDGQKVPSVGSYGQQTAIVSEANGLTVRFSAPSGTEIDPAILLYEWDFGDRGRSLLTEPVHTYAMQGTYQVRLVVRNITTGETVMSGETSVVAVGEVIAPPEDPNNGTGESGNTGGVLKVLFTLIGIVAFAVVLFVVLRILKNKTTGSLQQKIEKMEEKLFEPGKESPKAEEKKPDVPHLQLRTEVTKASPPDAQKVKAETVTSREEERKDFDPSKHTPEVPPTDKGPVPAWLKTDAPKQSVSPPPPQKKPEPAKATPPPLPTQPPKPLVQEKKPEQAKVTVPAEPPKAPIAPPKPPVPEKKRETPKPPPPPPSANPPQVTKPPVQEKSFGPEGSQALNGKPEQPKTAPPPPAQQEHVKKPEEKKAPPSPSTPTEHVDQSASKDEPIAMIRIDSLEDPKNQK